MYSANTKHYERNGARDDAIEAIMLTVKFVIAATCLASAVLFLIA